MQEIEIAVAQMKPGALVTVEIQRCRRVIGALSGQIERLGCGGGNQRRERVNAFKGVVHQEAPLGRNVVPATRGAAEQLHQIKTLADHSLVGVEAMV